MLLDRTCQPKTLFQPGSYRNFVKKHFFSLVPIGISSKNIFSAWFLLEFRQKTFFQPGSYWNFTKKTFSARFLLEFHQKSFLSVPHGTQPISFLPVPYETPHTFIKTNKKSKYLIGDTCSSFILDSIITN